MRGKGLNDTSFACMHIFNKQENFVGDFDMSSPFI